jgi:hypothetical protein
MHSTVTARVQRDERDAPPLHLPSVDRILRPKAFSTYANQPGKFLLESKTAASRYFSEMYGVVHTPIDVSLTNTQIESSTMKSSAIVKTAALFEVTQVNSDPSEGPPPLKTGALQQPAEDEPSQSNTERTSQNQSMALSVEYPIRRKSFHSDSDLMSGNVIPYRSRKHRRTCAQADTASDSRNISHKQGESPVPDPP